MRFGDKPLAWPSQGLLIDAVLAHMRSDNFVQDLTEHDSVSILYGFGQLLLDGTEDIIYALYKHLNNPAHISQLTEVQIMTLLNSFVHVRCTPILSELRRLHGIVCHRYQANILQKHFCDLLCFS